MIVMSNTNRNTRRGTFAFALATLVVVVAMSYWHQPPNQTVK